MKCTITEAFSKLNKVLTTYPRLAAVILQVTDGHFYASGVARDRNFGFTVELSDKAIEDFKVVVSPESLAKALKFSIKGTTITKEGIYLRGTMSNSEGAPVLDIKCDYVSEAMALDVNKLDALVKERIDGIDTSRCICKVGDVIKSWETLSKCGSRLFITEDLVYSMSAAANAFYEKDEMCSNLPVSEEPLQVNSVFIESMVSLQQAFSDVDFKVFTVNDGTVLTVLSEDRSIFIVEGASIPTEKHTLKRILSRLSDLKEFDKILLPQSALRDVLQIAVDKSEIEILSEKGFLEIKAGTVGKIAINTDEFDCQCLAYKDHTSLALGALPNENEIQLGYGDSGGRTFLSFKVGDVVVIIPVQDTTEV